MNLDDLMKKVIVNKKDKKNIDFNFVNICMTIGVRIILNYLFFIFFIGKFLAKVFKFNNLYFTSIILATIYNILITVNTIKVLNKKNNNDK